MNEPQMIAEAQRGDVSAFNQLVRAYQSLVYHTAYRVLGDGDAASDATQDAFISAYKNIKSFRGGSFKAWLLRIVTNACYDQLRAKQRKPTASLDALLVDPDNPAPGLGEAHEESPHAYAERQELGEWIHQGLQALPYDQRITLVLSDVDGFAYEEIALATNTNVGTVKSRLSRARAQMREFLLQQRELLPDAYRLKNRKQEQQTLGMENVQESNS
ncbi:sigma-70 family RNA polymerase sigma factor [Anaerolineae bacterium CFX7]|nr:sigma-70 family RNA polymerase sigma factor [Anaerolineae bacterium CFX7]